MINCKNQNQNMSMDNNIEKRMEDMLKIERELLISEVRTAVTRKLSNISYPYDYLLK